ncbi:hypothetical protein E3J48_04530 [Candidatus Aerophobetes bacterium]|uniref:Uncharacterized protein n=1 Tax=Aerophobetes bacterium TaxID=2030807 RepID=A0A523W5X6_UNCAE|nr:MAG: hypothetical protein E3J48_04530 [Candidatus Aerophobetes bacterium]
MFKNVGTMWAVQIMKAGINPNVRKLKAYEYYCDPASPTFINAYRSLVRVGYSHSYAKSYSSKVFDMPRFIEAMTRSYLSGCLIGKIEQSGVRDW